MAKPQPKRSRQLVTGGDPEQLYPQIPAEADFKKAGCDYVEGSDLEKIGEALIEHQGGFGHLRDRKIVYLWKKKGGRNARRQSYSRQVPAAHGAAREILRRRLDRVAGGGSSRCVPIDPFSG
jgi:hypothetical protein